MVRRERRHLVGRRPALLAWLLFLAWCAVVVRLTLWPHPATQVANQVLTHAVATPAKPIDVDLGWWERGANVALFLPFGGLLSLAWQARWRAVAVAAVASVAIELAQALWLPHRVATAYDVIEDTLGAALGVLAVAAAVRLRANRAAGRTGGRISTGGGDT